MSIINNPDVAEVFRNYPEPIREKMFFLRKLVIDTASETEGIDALEETLKWGEPAYLTKIGSTIRMDWKQSSPQQYALYFHCKTRLVERLEKSMVITCGLKVTGQLCFLIVMKYR